ncbi:tetratricopeptide repeat protein [Geobacter pelophilus]|uniref:Tetratricopeptide repeat protein n=1 Tax=Geoanaerobacter pelophilus TaxID=60036 RepID=A0AAW4L8S0_9BACT|nr:tetratricopeptide repeat protein [Geoanaerobacter pelophilus]MBT0666542.1 tetratricopeptide repeat protein [Geoanaerobacter pelophilus]
MSQVKEKATLLTALTASLVCLLLYLPVLNYGFINFDDPEYVLNNPVIRHLDLNTLYQSFFQSHVGWWMPLTWLSLAIDYQFWGLNPLGYHLTNIVFHAANTGLVVLIADGLLRQARGVNGESSNGLPEGGKYSGHYYAAILVFAGLCFGAHPLRVESVAWVTERKDVLNGFFAFSSILFYLHYAKRKDMGITGKQAGRFYALSLLCFVCSLMAKSVSVVLPAMLLVLDWQPLRRMPNRSFRQLILEKWPFFAASVLITLFTFFFAAQSRYLVTYEAFPLSQRIAVSGNAIWEYWRMLLVPVGLSPFNVIPDPIPGSYTLKASLVSLALLGIFFSGKVPRLSACMLCFILPLLPVLAFFQNGDQSYADRFTYLPSLSPAIFLALVLFTGKGVAGKLVNRRLVIVAAAIVVMIFMVATYRQQGVWRSPESFWTRIIQVEPLAIIYKERGKYYHSEGRYAEAVADFTAALGMITPTLKPYEYNFYAFRGEALRGAGRYEDAVADFATAISMYPHPAYFYHRGLALKSLGRIGEADLDFRRSGPDPGQIAWFDRGN